MLMMQVLEACLEDEQRRSKVKSLASLFEGSAQKACKRHKADINGPVAVEQGSDSPGGFRFNFSAD